MTEAKSSPLKASPPRRSWWRRFLVDPIANQLRQGVAPEKLGWASAVGITIGIIPIMGTVSAFSIATAAIFKLNQPVVHLFNRLMLPLHILLIVPFIRLGQRLYGAELLSQTVPELVARFGEDPGQFVRDFGLAAWHGFSAWLLLAPLLLFGLRYSLTPIYRAIAQRLSDQKEVNS